MNDFNEGVVNYKSLSIFHTNVNSVNAKFDELAVIIKMMKIKTDIFICTETWNIKSINLYKLDGYNLYYSEGNLNIADGVIVYVKKNIRYDVN